MKNIKRNAVFIALLWILLIPARDAHAYVDPGTAGYLYQILFIAFSGFIAFFAIFKNAIKSFLGSIFNKSSKKK